MRSSTRPSRTIRSRCGDAATAAVERVGAPPVAPGDHEAHVGIVGGQGVERPHQRRQVLPRLDGPDGEHEPVAAGQRPPPPGVAGPRTVGADTVVDGDDPVGVGAEHVDDLGPHELGRGVHPRAAPEGAADHPGERQRELVGELGVAHRRQVVDGHHLGRTGGRHDEVRAPHDVVATDPAVDQRVVGATPRLVERARRHRPVDDVDAGRDRVTQAAASAPRHREGGERHVVAARQPRHQLAGHHPDAGERGQLGRQVDRDAPRPRGTHHQWTGQPPPTVRST